MNESKEIQKNIGYQNPYIDYSTGMNNFAKYEEDNKIYKFDKLCMIKIQNAPMIIANIGQVEYFKNIKFLIENYEESEDFRRYLLSYDTIIIASSNVVAEKEFNDRLINIDEKIKSPKLTEIAKHFVGVMVIVLNQEKLIEHAYNQLSIHDGTQEKFIIANENTELVESTSREMKIIDIIQNAINNNKVIPYYQGIYSNNSGSIEKYEALMRIEDVDGEILTPFHFMDISKKYRMYRSINKAMVSRVLDDFENIDATVNLNINVHDITCKDFCDMLYTRLETYKNAHNIVFELLEDECFKEMETLKTFINKVKQYGVKIAVDDFGSGYSNLLKLVEIKPDFIKIDGEIIKNICKSKASQVVVETIIELAKKLNVSLVAEYAENKDIQNAILKYGIPYSQGFLFAKPLPIEKLDIKYKAHS